MKEAWRRLWQKAVTAPVAHPVVTIIITAVICVMAGLGASRLRPEPSMESMFDKNDPASRALLRVVSGFGAAEEMLLFARTPAEAAPDPDKLTRFAEKLREAIKASPQAAGMCDGVSYRVDPDMMRFFQEQLVPSGLYYLEEKDVAAAKERLTPEGMREQIAHNEALIATPGPAAQAIAKITLKDPLRLHEFMLSRLMASRPFPTYQNSDSFLTPDGRGLLIRIRGNQPPSEIEFAKSFTKEITRLVEQVNSEGLAVDFAGSYPIAAASEKAIRADMVASVTSSVICLQLLFIVMYRKPIRLFILAFLPVCIGVLMAFGLQSLFSDSITPLTGVIGAILAGMAIDYSVHLISDYEAHRRQGSSPRESGTQTAVTIAPALFAAYFTSVIGFLAIGSSSIPAIRGFAVLGAMGLTGSFLAALFVLPALLSFVDLRRSEQAMLKPQMRFSLFPLLSGIHRWRAGLMVASVVGLILCGVILVRSKEGMLPLETDLTVMHPRPNAPLEAQAYIAERFGSSPDAMIIHLQAADPAQLVTLAHQVRERLLRPETRRLGGISSTFGLAELLPDPVTAKSRAALVDPAEAERVAADFRAAISESSFEPSAYEPYAEFLKTLLSRPAGPGVGDLLKYRSLAMQLLPSDAVNSGQAPHEAITLVFTQTSLDLRSERSAAIETIRAALIDLPGATLTGINVLGHDAEHVIQRDLPRLTLIAAIAAALYLALHFRRVSPLVISLLPMVACIIVLLAMARLADVRLNMVNLVAAPLLIGIGVDYGIFLVSLSASTRRMEAKEIIGRIEASCHGIVVCALTTVLGFGSLYFTSVPAIASLGFATAVGVTACLVLTFTLILPILFMQRRR